MNENKQPIWVKALLDRELSQAAYRVFAYLFWRQGQNGQSWPSQRLISEHLQLTERAIRTITKKLESRGYIRIVRPDVQGRGQPLHYSIVDNKKGGTAIPPLEPKGGTGIPPLEQKRRNVGSKKGGTERPTNTKSITQRVKNNSHLLQIFNHWNSFKGCSVVKNDQTIRWHSHQPKADGLPSPEVQHAIKQALAGKYSIEQICQAITNYSKVLLGTDYKWTYVWSLPNFLTRGEEKHKQAARKWWRFLPDNFIEEHHLTDAAQRKRANQQSGYNSVALAELREHFGRKPTSIGEKQDAKIC